jgi:CelD/BcsL family acetyltransferase involved in cellulose biosynthesis
VGRTVRAEITQQRSTASLRATVDEWDDLWRRSTSSSPLDRAALIAHWVDQFSDAELRTIEVRQGGMLVAALPLVEHRRARALKMGGLPSNGWASCGTLLVDASIDPSPMAKVLADAINDLPWPLIQLFPVAVEAQCWQAFRDTCRGRGLTIIDQVVDAVGVVEISSDWQAYRATWSTNHRRHLDKAARRARLAGRLELDVHTDLASADIERWLKIGFEIEDRSWKGEAGTSVLRTPGMFQFFHEQAVQLADWRQLQLTFLKHNDLPIAFEYGYCAKGTYFSHKVGYDPAYSDYSPGQLLRALLIERLHRDGDVSTVDFCGPLTVATSKWSTRNYPIASWLIAPRRFLSRFALGGHRALSAFRRLPDLLRRRPTCS